MEKELQYKDEEGNVGTGQTITDLERNNRILEQVKKVMIYFAILFTAAFALIIWLIYYVISNSVVNNIVGSCVC